MNNPHADTYFKKTFSIMNETDVLTYGVFLRHDVVCAIEPALAWLREQVPTVKITRHFKEGTYVPAERCLFSYEGTRDIVPFETELLQHVGLPCVCAYNAYQMALACKTTDFLDMHARHAAGHEMAELSAYGCATGSNSAKMQGANGFVGSSLDATADYFGLEHGLGTMPHTLIGYCGSTLGAVQAFMETFPDDRLIVALVDYFGREIRDSIQCANWFREQKDKWADRNSKTLGIRLDTHGGRFAEGLDYEKSVDTVGEWLHTSGEWAIVRKVMGEDVFEMADISVRDRVRGMLFGKGVSAANIMNTREHLDKNGHRDVLIVASSGFNLRKCKVMEKASAPINLIGTGSFLPENLSDTYATSDCYKKNGHFSVKVGREHIFVGL
jgi:nicotinate phosphoribosyltransferase